MAVDFPDPDLNAKHLFTRAAPLSDTLSEDEPADGNVSTAVDVELLVSVMIVNPLGSLLMLAVEAVEAVGVVDGRSGNSSDIEKMAENFRVAPLEF